MALKPGNGTDGERDPRLDRLYRDAPREAPPAHLDAAILAAARREVGARPRPLSALRRWRVPVSIAAIVVLSVSLVTLVREEGGDTLLRDQRAPAAPRPPRAAESAPQPTEAAKAPEGGERAARAPDARKRAAPTQEELTLRRDEAAALAATEAGRPMEGESARSSAEPAPRASAPAGPDPVASSPAPVAGVFSYRLQEAPARAEADAAPRPAPSQGTRGSAADSAPPASPQAKPLLENRRFTEQAPRASAAKRPPPWQGLEQEPAQKWLERLGELRKQGRTAEAEELLAEIKRRFPNHPLPSGGE